MNKHVLVITGSARTGRAGGHVAKWVMDRLASRSGADYELVDLKELDLPFMDEPAPPMTGTEPVNDHTKAWKKKISESDGFIFVTPEYNHGYSPVLKNAIDYLYAEWKDKPAAFVGYGGSGAGYAIGQLKQVFDFVGLRPIDCVVGISEVWSAVDETGKLDEKYVTGSVDELAVKLEEALEADAVTV